MARMPSWAAGVMKSMMPEAENITLSAVIT